MLDSSQKLNKKTKNKKIQIICKVLMLENSHKKYSY